MTEDWIARAGSIECEVFVHKVMTLARGALRVMQGLCRRPNGTRTRGCSSGGRRSVRSLAGATRK